jgi:hypothetical protein
MEGKKGGNEKKTVKGDKVGLNYTASVEILVDC